MNDESVGETPPPAEELAKRFAGRSRSRPTGGLEDLGWTLYPRGDPAQWDGLLAWFRQVIGKYQPLVEQHSLPRRWAEAW